MIPAQQAYKNGPLKVRGEYEYIKYEDKSSEYKYIYVSVN